MVVDQATIKGIRRSCERRLVRKYDLPPRSANLDHAVADATADAWQLLADGKARHVGAAVVFACRKAAKAERDRMGFAKKEDLLDIQARLTVAIEGGDAGELIRRLPTDELREMAQQLAAGRTRREVRAAFGLSASRYRRRIAAMREALEGGGA